jgi:hypothetical protein
MHYYNIPHVTIAIMQHQLGLCIRAKFYVFIIKYSCSTILVRYYTL